MSPRAADRTASRPAESGFTLVELLVAMALTGLVMLLVMQGLRFTATARERMLAYSDGIQDLVLGRSLIQRELSRAQVKPWGEAGKKRLAFAGDAERMRFVNVAPAYRRGEVWQLWELALEPTPRGGRELLVRRAPLDQERPGFEPLEAVRPRLLATIDAPIAFEFFDRSPDNPRGRWLPRWTEPLRLPLAVRLGGGADAWPDLVVRLGIELGGHCAAEGNEETLGCAG